MTQDLRTNVIDAMDIETFLACSSEEEAREMSVQLFKQLGFSDVDLVYVRFAGPGARVRVRAYLYRPGSSYAWLEPKGGRL